MGLHGKVGRDLLNQAQEEQKARRKKRLRRHNRLISCLIVVPFGLTLTTMFMLAYGAITAELPSIAMVAILIFALADISFIFKMLTEVIDWWLVVMPCYNQYGRECTLSDMKNVTAVVTLGSAMMAAVIIVAVDGEAAFVVLGSLGFAVTMVAFVMVVLFHMISNSEQKVERAKQIYDETGSSGAVLLKMLRRKKED